MNAHIDPSSLPEAPRDEHSIPDAKNSAETEVPPLPSAKLFLIVLLGGAALLGLGTYGHFKTDTAAAETQKDAIDFTPNVRTLAAKLEGKAVELSLPGQTAAFDTANIFPRATGYIGERFVDIGSRVKKGDPLVRISSPDLDRQLDQALAQLSQVQAALLQAHAQVSQANANLKLGNLTFSRADALTQRGYETVQNRDNQQANVTTQQAAVETAVAGVKVAEANVSAQQAAVDRLRTLSEFENVTAPFNGIVTARNIDAGDLVNADAGGGVPMFTMMRDDVLRVSVDVPQSSAIGIYNGLEAKVIVPQMQGRTFAGRVARNAGALVPSSRALTVEVDVDNKDHALRSGLFVDVEFSVPRDHPNVVIPAEALVFNQNGLQVAVVEQEDQIRMMPVKVYRDFGTSVEVSDGLRGGERVVLSPPASLQDGTKVKVVPEKGREEAEK